jgi:hypothetical protein
MNKTQTKESNRLKSWVERIGFTSIIIVLIHWLDQHKAETTTVAKNGVPLEAIISATILVAIFIFVRMKR